MGEQFPPVDGLRVRRAFERMGWYVVRQTGSHAQLRHAERAGLLAVPQHRGRPLPPGTLHNIPEHAGLTAEEFRELV